MKKPLLLLALMPVLFIGCASDRSHDRATAAENMHDPAYVGQTGSDHIDRADARYRVPEAGDTDRRQVRTRDEELRTSDRPVRDSIAPTVNSDLPGTSPAVDDTIDYNDRYPDQYTPAGLNHYKKHRWSRFQY